MARLAFIVIGLLIFGLVSANELLICRVIEPKLNGAKIEAVQPSPIPGLMEVRFRTPQGMHILYTDPKGENIVQGEIYDAKSGRNLTDERISKLTAIKFESLPLNQAVKIV